MTREDLVELFLRHVEARTGAVPRKTDDDRFGITIDGVEYLVSLENPLRDATRDSDPEIMVQFADAVLMRPSHLPPWHEAAPGLRVLVGPRDLHLDGFIHKDLTPATVEALCYSDPEEKDIRFLSHKDLEAWRIIADEAYRVARQNLDRSLAATALEVSAVGECQVGMLATFSPYKASLILAPGLKQRLQGELGWPAYAVVPARDFVLLFSDQSLIPRMGEIVLREYQNSGYPITTEVLELSDGGIVALGSFEP